VPAAASRGARAALGSGVRAVDRARSGLRRADPDEALAIWRGLVAGRWSLLDHVERDGKRFLLARRNDLAVAPVDPLTLAERQVAAYAALGHANKLIAYELGLEESAVAMRLHRVERKLGVRTRAELIRLFRARFAGTAPARAP
jgi:DNA-binding CsgD family transcriptional regulator